MEAESPVLVLALVGGAGKSGSAAEVIAGMIGRRSHLNRLGKA
jgi:hypothetical protein